jgi:Uri superfamily endonuclease
LKPLPATYQLLIELRAARTIAVGCLGRFRFPAGWYVYTGSARRGIDARVARHRKRDKPLHWHIDWLLAAPGAQVRAVRTLDAAECAANARLHGEIIAPGFGASDCRAGCGSHLKRIGDAPPAGRWIGIAK